MAIKTPTIQILKDKDVAQKLCVARSTVWVMVKNISEFPKPFSISSNTTGWYEHEVDAYIALKAASR